MIKSGEGSNIQTNATEIGKLRECCKYFYANILENLEEMGKFHEMGLRYSMTKWSLTHIKKLIMW